MESVENADDKQAVGVVAVHSVARAIDSAVVLRGQTEADREVELRSETSGQVISDPLRKGSFVEEGQLLCSLDPAAREATLAEAQARLQEAKSRIPEAEARLDEARARLEEARINDNAAAKPVRGRICLGNPGGVDQGGGQRGNGRCRDRAVGPGGHTVGHPVCRGRGCFGGKGDCPPVDPRALCGILESDTAELGSLLQPGALCATVIQLDPVMLVGFVPETEVNRVELGARAGGRLATGEEIEGKVTFLSRAADSETRTFRVEIEVPNPDLRLRDGQTAEIVIAADGTSAHLLPQSALTLNDEGAMGVRIVTEEQTAQFVPVTLLRDTPNGVWLAGLPDKADVIIIGQEFVTDGVRVEPAFQEVSQ